MWRWLNCIALYCRETDNGKETKTETESDNNLAKHCTKNAVLSNKVSKNNGAPPISFSRFNFLTQSKIKMLMVMKANGTKYWNFVLEQICILMLKQGKSYILCPT